MEEIRKYEEWVSKWREKVRSEVERKRKKWAGKAERGK